MDQPLISIITINRNNADGLRKTMQSVLSQTFDNYEYIIIDGASTDSSVEVIKSFVEDPKYADKIGYWVSEPDKGIYDAMNKGIMKSHGEWINFMNSGDSLYNEETLSNVADNITDKDNVIYGITYDYQNQVRSDIQINKLKLLQGNMVCHQSIFARRKTFDNNMFDTSFKIIADKKWFCRCYHRKKVRQIRIPVCYYEDIGVSSNSEKLQAESKKFLPNAFGLHGRLILFWDWLWHLPIRCLTKICRLLRGKV